MKCYFSDTQYSDKFSKYLLKKFNNAELLKSEEIEIMEKNGCCADSWDQIRVRRPFLPQLVRNTVFHGTVIIGRLEKAFFDVDGSRYHVGISNCIISSCCIDDYPSVSFSSLWDSSIGKYVVIHNCGEISCNGKSQDYRLRLINEAGGREAVLFPGITLQEIWLQTSFPDKGILHEKLAAFTEGKRTDANPELTVIGDHSLIKNVKYIRNSRIGRHCIIDSASGISGSHIASSATHQTRIADNAIVRDSMLDAGSTVETGAIAENSYLAGRVSLSLGARVISCAVGPVSHISCCEVQNALIFPLHEQHHNNSFLIAASIGGQSNIAAGATLGSNHNSRRNDGELMANRGFWAGLCTSVKHNSSFASFTLLAKSDFSHEMDIRLPFSLVSENKHTDSLEIMPAYWWRHNMYALFRNRNKFMKRLGKEYRGIECDFLAPDTAEEILKGIDLLKKESFRYENSDRETVIRGRDKGLKAYREMLLFYCCSAVISYLQQPGTDKASLMGMKLDDTYETGWHNAAGILVGNRALEKMISDIENGEIISWDEVGDRFGRFELEYRSEKFRHAVHLLGEIYNSPVLDEKMLERAVKDYRKLAQDINEELVKSREKDFSNPFRKVTYRSRYEMEAVLGTPDDDIMLNDMHIDVEE